MNNPYSKMLKLIQGEGSKLNPPTIELGIIVSIEPLVIKIGGLQLDKDNLLVAEHLLTHKRILKYTDSQEYELETTLNNGNMVVCYAVLDGQKYVVLEKVI